MDQDQFFILFHIYIYMMQSTCCSCFSNFVVFLFYFPHMRLCILFSISGNIQVDSIELLSTLATDK